MEYRYLKAGDMVRYGDERWDYELGWTVNRDRHMERFSREYRRVDAKDARLKRFRRLRRIRTGDTNESRRT